MRRPVISVIAGIICAVGALWFVYASRAPQAKAEATAPTTSVLVAASDIPFGTTIVADMIAKIDWPAAAVPREAVLDKKEILETPDGARIAMRSFVAGEPFLKAKLSGYGERPILSRKVAEGMRAFTIRINDVSGVAGFLLPGDRVDVMLTREPENERQRDNKQTTTLLQNVTVLGIDQLASEETDDPTLAKSTTLEVTPEQAQKLALASEVGSLSLSLRNYKNLDEAATRTITVSDLGGERKSAPALRRDEGIYVRVRKSGEASQERVPQ